MDSWADLPKVGVPSAALPGEGDLAWSLQIDSQIIIMFNDTSTLDNTLLLPTYYYLENKYL